MIKAASTEWSWAGAVTLGVFYGLFAAHNIATYFERGQLRHLLFGVVFSCAFLYYVFQMYKRVQIERLRRDQAKTG